MVGLKSFFVRWYGGLKSLTPEQLLFAKMVGHLGAGVGMFFAILYLGFSGNWAFIVFCFFIGFMQFVDFFGLRKQWCLVREQDERLKELVVEENGFDKIDSGGVL